MSFFLAAYDSFARLRTATHVTGYPRTALTMN
jgi:hypothetical protein